jgi:hypothetical protein
VPTITAADVRDAAVRICERDGISLADLRERVRLGGIAARTKPCQQCGTVWTAAREGARFCSGGCRSQWNRENGNES